MILAPGKYSRPFNWRHSSMVVRFGIYCFTVKNPGQKAPEKRDAMRVYPHGIFFGSQTCLWRTKKMLTS